MSVPFWYQALWAASALGYLAVCIAIVRSSSLRLWPSVFAISANRAAWFVVGRALLPHYKLYFYAYYTESWILAALDLWLAIDVYRSIPASRFFANSFKQWALCISLASGAAIAWLTIPHVGSTAEIFLSRLGRSLNLALAGMALSAIIWFLVHGLGFSETGFSIAAGALARLSSSLVKSHAAAVAIAHHSPMNIKIQTADTAVSLLVAAYWTMAIAKRSTVESRERQQWETAAGHPGDILHAKH